MARQNMVYLYGKVHKDLVIAMNNETGEYNHAACYLYVVRSNREVDDDVRYVKHDKPMIMTRDQTIIEKITQWKENTVVLVKGTLTTIQGNKASFCQHCLL
jgi:hypothetical protein